MTETAIQFNQATETEIVNQNNQEENVISLTQFIDELGEGLMESVSKQNPPVYDGVPNPEWDRILDNLKRKPFDAQRDRVQAVCKFHILEANRRRY